jgi:hypothetical protein
MPRSRNLPRLRLVVLVLLLCFVPACANRKVNKANYEKITEGMTLEEVQAILGEGKKEEKADISGMAGHYLAPIPGAAAPKQIGDVYLWERGEQEIQIGIVDGKVRWKHSKGI